MVLSFAGKKVSKEINRIMGPSSTNLSYNFASRSLMSGPASVQIERKPKRKSKLRISEELHGMPKRRLSTAVFQKKIIVFNYMGASSPKGFSRCDKNICLAGLLPAISLEASEETVRKEICEVIHSCSSPNLSNIGPEDFEFVAMNGKHGAIPQCKKGFKWNGRAVKELAGSGSVYVRLKKDCAQSHSDDDDDDLLPPGPCAILNSFDNSQENNESLNTTVVENVPVELSSKDESNLIPGSDEGDHVSVIDLDSSIEELDISSGSTTESSSANPVTGSTNFALNTTGISVNTTSSSSTRSCSSAIGPSLADTVSITANVTANYGNTASSSGTVLNISTSSSNVEDDLVKLQDMFSNMSKDQLQYIYGLCSCFNRTVEALLEGPSLEALRSLAVSQITLPLEECPKIRLHEEDDDDDWMEAAFTFYKGRGFDKKAGVRISIRGQPAVDTGGIRRQFFSVVFTKLASESTGIFDGPPNRLRPAYKASMLTSGILSTIGTMIAHSFLLDGQGFPFMAEYCFYYIAGCHDLALSYVTIDDTSENVKRILSKVS